MTPPSKSATLIRVDKFQNLSMESGRRDLNFGFQTYYEEMAKPFEWKFTRTDLAKLMRPMTAHTGGRLAALRFITGLPSQST